MRRDGNLYHKIYDFENLYNSYKLAKKGKRYNNDVIRFTRHLERNLITIQNELIWHEFEVGKYNEFYVYEPKKRLIKSLPFRDRIVQHSLNTIINPLLDKRFIYDTYACRADKGTHAGADRVTYFLRKAKRKWDKVYCLQADVSKYFYSIDHDILMNIYKTKIKCKDTLQLLDKIIRSDGDGVGIPIGNLTSQLSANLYLNELDQFVKHRLKVKFYVRYMDDFVLIHKDKDYLWNVLEEIEAFLHNKLKLHLNNKTDIFPIKRGLDFLGYRIWPTHRLLRKKSKKKIKRRMIKYEKQYLAGKLDIKTIQRSLAGWLGHAKFANTYNLRMFLLDKWEDIIKEAGKKEDLAEIGVD